MSLMDAYRPASSMRFQRYARASALTIAGSARLDTMHRSADAAPAGDTIVFRPGRCRIASGTWTVMLFRPVMLPDLVRRRRPSEARQRGRSDRPRAGGWRHHPGRPPRAQPEVE